MVLNLKKMKSRYIFRSDTTRILLKTISPKMMETLRISYSQRTLTGKCDDNTIIWTFLSIMLQLHPSEAKNIQTTTHFPFKLMQHNIFRLQKTKDSLNLGMMLCQFGWIISVFPWSTLQDKTTLPNISEFSGTAFSLEVVNVTGNQGEDIWAKPGKGDEENPPLHS